MSKNFDEVDISILEILQVDGAISNQALAERVHVSPATCLRRVQRLEQLGIIERRVAVLNRVALAAALGLPASLACMVEVSLDRQSHEDLQVFEKQAVACVAVQQCWRVASGPDFILIVQVPDMAAYQELAQTLFTQNANVRNVKAYFATHCAKQSLSIPLPAISVTPVTSALGHKTGRNREKQ